ncbi:hypothetical protein BV898_14603 [Hypsibius exemplaris]|uniref:Uncharacterized protein n=1 Tax=Hypsibius exemplaris TaxID=2072580 RepID=A0A9X6RJN4_HYPEX|nr:hypothetical protein BV898_14603 [Hypsibius exemplaris]
MDGEELQHEQQQFEEEGQQFHEEETPGEEAFYGDMAQWNREEGAEDANQIQQEQIQTQELAAPLKEEQQLIEQWYATWQVMMREKEVEFAQQKEQMEQCVENFRAAESDRQSVETTVFDEMHGRHTALQKIDQLQRMGDDLLEDEVHLAEVAQNYEVRKKTAATHDRALRSKYQALVTSFEESRRSHDTEMDDLRQRLASSEARTKEREMENQNLMREVGEKRAQAVDADAALASSMEKIEALEAEIASLTEQIVDGGAEAERADQQLENLQLVLERRAGARDLELAKRDELKKGLEVFQANKSRVDVDHELAVKERNVEASSSAIVLHSLTSDTARKKERIQFLQIVIKEHETAKQEILTETNNLIEKLRNLKAELERKEAVEKTILAETSPLHVTLRALEGQRIASRAH